MFFWIHSFIEVYPYSALSLGKKTSNNHKKSNKCEENQRKYKVIKVDIISIEKFQKGFLYTESYSIKLTYRTEPEKST